MKLLMMTAERTHSIVLNIHTCATFPTPIFQYSYLTVSMNLASNTSQTDDSIGFCGSCSLSTHQSVL